MADIQIITDVPLFTNEQKQNDKKLIVLSPSSLPFDDNPTKDSHNLVSSNTIYELSETLNTNINILSDKLETLETQVQNVVPIGTVIAFAGNPDNVPSGYLFCGGGEVSRTDYAKLFAVIGTTYGAGDGETTFILPNLTNKFIMGNGTAGTVKEAGLPNIYGSFFTWRTTQDVGVSASYSGAFSFVDRGYKRWWQWWKPLWHNQFLCGEFKRHIWKQYNCSTTGSNNAFLYKI